MMFIGSGRGMAIRVHRDYPLIGGPTPFGYVGSNPVIMMGG